MKNKQNVIKTLNKLWKEKDTDEDAEIKEEDRKMFLDPCNVAGFIPKKEWVRKALTELYDVGEGSNIPELKYREQCGSNSRYSCEYLRVLLELTKHYETLRLSVGVDYPLRAECEDFVFILAPRVGVEA